MQINMCITSHVSFEFISFALCWLFILYYCIFVFSHLIENNYFNLFLTQHHCGIILSDFGEKKKEKKKYTCDMAAKVF